VPDDATLQCIVGITGFLPTGPDDPRLTDQQRLEIARECFGEDIPDDATIQCIVGITSFLPTGPDDPRLTDQQRLEIGRKCFGKDVPDDATLQCIVGIAGFVPTGPGDPRLTREQLIRIGQECFGEEHRDEGTPDDATLQCIVGITGFVPTGPGDPRLDGGQLRRIARECFDVGPGGPPARADTGAARSAPAEVGQRPDQIDTQTSQCIIDLIGFLPTGPDDPRLAPEQLQLISQRCFNQAPGVQPQRPEGQDTRVGNLPVRVDGPGTSRVRCIVKTVGFVPTGAEDPRLTADMRSRLFDNCFRGEAGPTQQDRSQPGPPQGPRVGASPPAGPRGRTEQSATAAPQPGLSTGQQPPAGAAPTGAGGQPGAARGQVVLSQLEQDVVRTIQDYNKFPEMDAIRAIDIFSALMGSKSAGITLLSKVNHHVIKGKELTDEDLLQIVLAVRKVKSLE
jgi:hypothetical protein